MALAEALLRQVSEQGKSEEKQLVERWQKELADFLGAFETGILNKQQGLELGLEQEPVLKLIIKRKALPPHAGLLRLCQGQDSPITPMALYAIQHNLDCHVGIRLSADECRREIYVYSSEHASEQALFQLMTSAEMPALPGQLRATALALDENTGISAYCTQSSNPQLNTEQQHLLEQQAQILCYPKLTQHCSSFWRHYRLENGLWHGDKTGLEFADPSIAVLARTLSHYSPQMPYFRYLIPVIEKHNFIIASRNDQVAGWYFTLA